MKVVTYNPPTMAGVYDALAADYDSQVERETWMRDVLWESYARLFRPGQVVLDVGCGTGTDAVFLAERGVRVLGIDASAAMIARARSRVESGRVSDLVDLRVMDVSEVSRLKQIYLDGMISAFSVLSAVPDLEAFATAVAPLLPSRAPVVLHLLNRSCIWEWLGLVRRGRWSDASQIWRSTERDFLIGGCTVRHHLYTASEAYAQFFRPHFRLLASYGLGFLRPPHTLRWIPAMASRAASRLERPLRSRRPFAEWGRFWVLELERV